MKNPSGKAKCVVQKRFSKLASQSDSAEADLVKTLKWRQRFRLDGHLENSSQPQKVEPLFRERIRASSGRAIPVPHVGPLGQALGCPLQPVEGTRGPGVIWPTLVLREHVCSTKGCPKSGCFMEVGLPVKIA
ncbi:unnamed protein product [Ixodes pacificus]